MAVFTVNGQKVEPTGNQKLLRFLRDELHLTSVKDGCSEGACGACTVIIDGKTCKACVPDTDLLDGRTVITVEGLTEWEREVYTYAYGKAGAVQCGFCIPGMVMCTKALLDVNKEPTDDEIKYALRNNYCRCTGYVKIMDAVRLAAKVLKTGVIPDDLDPDWNIGHRVSRVDVEEKVLGTGEKPAWRSTPDVTAGFTPQPSQFESMSQAELNAQAKALLAAAGYGPNRPLKLTLLYNTSENHQKIAIAVASMWKKNLGVEVKLQNQEWKTYIDSRNTGNFDVIRASWVGDYNEPSTFLSLLTSTHSGNISRFNDPAYDKILAQAAVENSAKARNDDYNAAEKIIMVKAPIAPIYQYTNGRLIKPWLKGYPITNPEDVAYSRTMYIVKH